MRIVECEACQKEVPMGTAFTVADRTLCPDCLKQFAAQPEASAVKKGSVAGITDPTVCAQCGADGGAAELPRLAGAPVCEKCENFFRNRPYPTWLKISLGVMLCLAVAAFFYNLRFFIAYVDLRRGAHAMERGDIAKAAELYEAASQHLPEIPELKVTTNFFKAQKLLAEDKNEEALALIENTHGRASDYLQKGFRQLRAQAEMGIAFKKHDYDTFLDRAKQVADEYPSEPQALAAVASAYACKYIETGDKSFAEQANEWLDKAKAVSGDSPEFKEYENRIQHRLKTREIIPREEFQKRYPNGWKPES